MNEKKEEMILFCVNSGLFRCPADPGGSIYFSLLLSILFSWCCVSAALLLVSQEEMQDVNTDWIPVTADLVNSTQPLRRWKDGFTRRKNTPIE